MINASDERLAAQAESIARQWPRCGASAIIFRRETVLLIQRAKGGFAGLWAPPGGHIEAGERAIDAAVREVREETGLGVEISGLLDVHDVITRAADGTLTAHYLLAVYFGRSTTGEPQAASDCRDARFFSRVELDTLAMTPGLPGLIDKARALTVRLS